MFGQLVHQLLSLFHQYFNSLLCTQVIFFGRLPPDILIIHWLVNPIGATLPRSRSGHCLGTITPSRTGSSRRSRHFLLKHAKSVLSRCQNSCVSGIRSVGSSKKNRGNYAPGAWKCASTHLCCLCVFRLLRTLMEQWHLMKEDEHQIYCLLGRLDDMGRAILWDLTTSAFNWSCSW